MNFSISNKRHSGVTLYGAIGKCLKHAVFMTAASTNSVSFLEFLENVVQAFRASDNKPYLIVDNHRAHHS